MSSKKTESQTSQVQNESKVEGSDTKRPYQKPEIKSESLMAFGALCNGTSSGGRKASTGAPGFCGASKLLS